MHFELEYSDDSVDYTEKAKDVYEYKSWVRKHQEELVGKLLGASLVFAVFWMVVDYGFLQSHNPFPIGVWHGQSSSLVILMTSIWGLGEIYYLNEELGKRSCRFKVLRMMTWFTFIFVSFIEVVVLTLLLFYRNTELPEGFET